MKKIMIIMMLCMSLMSGCTSKKEEMKMPDVSGLSESQMASVFESTGIIPNIQYVYNAQVAKGMVISQDPMPETLINEDSTITIVISLSGVEIPDVVKKDEASARKLLLEEMLLPIIVYESSTSIPSGQVIKSQPEAKSIVKVGERVILTISSGTTNIKPQVVKSSVESLNVIFSVINQIVSIENDTLLIDVTMQGDCATTCALTPTSNASVVFNQDGIEQVLLVGVQSEMSGTMKRFHYKMAIPLNGMDPQTLREAVIALEVEGSEYGTFQLQMNFTW